VRTIFLTGATGFIGFHIAQSLAKSGYHVIAPVRSAAHNNKMISMLTGIGVSVQEGVFFDQKLLDAVAEKEIFAVIHLAAIRGQQNISPAEYERINVVGTETLLDFARRRGINRFLYFSTVGVAGTIPADQPASNRHPARPDTVYHRTKWESEQLARSYHTGELRTLTLRPTITYGKYDNGFIPRLIEMVRNNRFILSGNPVSIHLLNVESVARLASDIIEADCFDGESYILADKYPVELSQLVNLIYQYAYGRSYPSWRRLPAWIFDAAGLLFRYTGNSGLSASLQLISQNWIFDISATQEKLKYNPSDTLEEIPPIVRDCLNDRSKK
jgi:nucleoside-diphosphate-sugar epimerase